MPEDKILQGAAHPQLGEDRGQFWGQRCPLNGEVNKSYCSVICLDLEHEKEEDWGYLVTAVKKISKGTEPL